jgi:hypothetical protein
MSAFYIEKVIITIGIKGFNKLRVWKHNKVKRAYDEKQKNTSKRD